MICLTSPDMTGLNHNTGNHKEKTWCTKGPVARSSRAVAPGAAETFTTATSPSLGEPASRTRRCCASLS
jgi:hypothetical protein